MNISVELIAVLAGLAINLIALLIAWGNVNRSQTAQAVAQAERWAQLTAEVTHLREDLRNTVSRLERDVQNLYQFHRELKDSLITYIGTPHQPKERAQR